jgi:hypothetical protein
VASHTWKRADFQLTPEGVVRLQPTLAGFVAQKAMLGQVEINRVMELLAHLLS